MTKVEVNFLALVAVQAPHSIEEYVGRLWEVFPPAAFVTGLVSQNRERGFILINVALLVFGLWCFFWPVRRRWPMGRAFIGVWIVIEVINGIGHPLWTLQQRAYTPGVATAPVLLILALSLLWQLTKNSSLA
jgi:Protein of unknown function with HXXEE motif